MLEIREKLKTPRAASSGEVRDRLTLPFELRQKSRLRATLESGVAVALMLPRGQVLRGGDLLMASDGRVVEVIAQPERVLHVACATTRDLARAAYHLGNRHAPVQVGEEFLRIAADHVLEGMLKGLGATVQTIEAPFEPEAGAYGGGHDHGNDDRPVGKIHHYGDDPQHAHPHGHEHDDDHDELHRQGAE